MTIAAEAYVLEIKKEKKVKMQHIEIHFQARDSNTNDSSQVFSANARSVFQLSNSNTNTRCIL